MNNNIQQKLSDEEILQRKKDSIERAVNRMTAFYRENPHRLVRDFLNISLKPFQEINLNEMVHSTNTMYVAARGQKALPISDFRVINWGISVKSKSLLI